MARRNGGFLGQDGLDAPDPPTGVAATAGGGSVSVAFTAPSDVGTSAITGFVAQVSTDNTAYSAGSNTGTSSPIVVSSLTDGTDYTAKVWAINAYGTSVSSEASTAVSPDGTRALFAGGDSQQRRTDIEYITVVSTGNATDFGDLLNGGSVAPGSVASTSRSVHGGGNTVSISEDDFGANSNVTFIQYSTIASTGNATDFGDMSVSMLSQATISNGTRGVWGDDTNNVSSTRMEYITIATLGNSSDFGDTSAARGAATGASSPTRGVVAGGYYSNGTVLNVIEYITTANTGNTTDFGDLTVARYGPSACSSNTRACIFGGTDGNATLNTIDYITTASTGNATDFGDLAAANYSGSATSSKTRGVYAGGRQPQAPTGDMVYITIASTGNTSAFGSLSTRYSLGGSSSNHGGLS